MIKADELVEAHAGLKYRDGTGINLAGIQRQIEEAAYNSGIPVAFEKDTVRSGNLLKSSFEDCLVMYHPQHKDDYVKYCLRLRHQGQYSFLSFDVFGSSKQLKKENMREAYEQDRASRGFSLRPAELLNNAIYKTGSRIGQAIATIGRDKQGLEDEKMYYTCIDDIFDDLSTVLYYD